MNNTEASKISELYTNEEQTYSKLKPYDNKSSEI
jgi:hypothetical protein